MEEQNILKVLSDYNSTGILQIANGKIHGP